jgi:diguanylate cyclase
MMTNNPIEVARETLKQLSSRKLLPTPDNFERIYCELMQTPSTRESQLANRLLLALEAQLTGTPDAKTALSALRQGVAAGNLELIPQLTVDCMGQITRQGNLTRSWGSLVQELIRCWDLRQPDLSQHFKQAGLQRVLANYGNQPEELNKKLAGLVSNWAAPPSQREKLELVDEDPPAQEKPSAGGRVEVDAPMAASVAPQDLAALPDESWGTWQRALAYALKHGLEPRLLNHPDLLDDLERLINELDRLHGSSELDEYLTRLRTFMIHLELQSQQEGRLVTSLAGLLKLMLDNIAELNPTDSYLVGQVSSLQEVLSHEPLSMQQLYLLETSLREVIRKQGTLKVSLDEAASSMRDLLDRFITRLSLMTNTTDAFHEKINHHSQRLKQTRDLGELDLIITDLVEDTVEMQSGLQQSSNELVDAREQVEAAERRIRELETALESASNKVKEDQLTGAYNRRGLAEHFQREINRSERALTPLCVALLDVDNFKQLNDHYGHLAGDEALIYLVDVIRANIRPADVVARFGGEEFVLLMPDTGLEEALDTVRRLQRELTKTFFMANNNRMVITFSAGVAQWHIGERDVDVTERADQAMYQAKLAGKNRVCSAEEELQDSFSDGA